jgi:endonuclease/exonuclease/phosphatase family metal-dependent hydrolase
VRACTWNLFHGRDRPPERGLFTWRSRLLRTGELGERYAQVNRPLFHEFAGALCGIDWDVALLQETPPRWLRPLGWACRAGGAGALTSRNQLAFIRARVADWNPDLIKSHESGSNGLLVRSPGRLGDVRRLTLSRRPERRRMLFARVQPPGGGRLAVANLHASAGAPERAVPEVMRAAECALEWAGHDPLLFGGDLNLRPAEQPELFAALEERYGLAPSTSPKAIDHLLVKGLDVVEPPRALPGAARELPGPEGRRIRLSDHAPVTAAFRMR